MTKMSFYNGLREIGGTFVAIETEKAVCMFDFGFSVQGHADEKIAKRKDYAADYIRLGMLTPMDGIYDKATAAKTGLKAAGETEKKYFFIISHIHIDHMGGLGSLAKEVPVYMSTDSLKLYRRLEANHDVQDAGHDNCIGVEYGESFTIEDITVKVVRIDHDVVGACGYMISTPDGNVCYTGDYRFHGFHPEATRTFAEECKGADYLITEGVTLSFNDIDILSLTEPEPDDRTEPGLQDKLYEYAKTEQGLLIVNPYNRNVERIHNMVNTIKSAGRKLILDGVCADYCSTFYPEDEIYVYKETLKDKTPFDGWKVVDRETILNNPQDYVLQLDHADTYELFDLKDKVSKYIHIDGTPLGDYDPSYEKLHKLLESMGIDYVSHGLGGHAKPYYIRWMIDTIAPKTLIPLHSFRPEQIKSEKAKNTILPKYGDTITFGE